MPLYETTQCFVIKTIEFTKGNAYSRNLEK